MIKLANWMKQVAELCQEAAEDGVRDIESFKPEEFAIIRDQVKELALRFPIPNTHN